MRVTVAMSPSSDCRLLISFAGSGEGAAVEATALVAFAPLVIFYNVVAVVVLQIPSGLAWRSAGVSALHGIATNPILIGILMGLLLSMGDIALPTPVQRTLTGVGQMALPLALLSIGGALCGTRLRGNLHRAVVAALMKVALTPLLGWGIAVLIGLDGEAIRLMLIFLAAPCAAAGHVLVKQMHGDAALAASTIVLSHLFALPSMLIVLALTA